MNIELDPGIAALGAALIAAVVALVTLFLSLASSRRQAKFEAYLHVSKDISGERRNLIYRQLTEFYDPLFTLLSVNSNTFEKIGPGSEARTKQLFPDEESGRVWSQLVDTVILPNNGKACEIIEKKLHLIIHTDDTKPYLDFATHAHAYKVFREQVYEAYRLFAYPKGILEHVTEKRRKLQDEVNNMLQITSDTKRKKRWLLFTL